MAQTHAGERGEASPLHLWVRSGRKSAVSLTLIRFSSEFDKGAVFSPMIKVMEKYGSTGMSDYDSNRVGQKIFYGVDLGILMVRTYFTRYLGDIGNAATWEFPVSYKVVHDAVPSRVTNLHNASLLEPFKAAAGELAAEGVEGITTTCGFLSIYQKELAESCGVPVATSALLQLPLVQTVIGSKKRVGVMTYNGEALDGPYFEAVGVPLDTPVKGMPQDGEFVRWIRDGDASVPFETLQAEVVAAAREFLAEYPDLGAIVCECTNLAPFSADISDALALPVFDCQTLVNWFHAGLKPKRHHPGLGARPGSAPLD